MSGVAGGVAGLDVGGFTGLEVLVGVDWEGLGVAVLVVALGLLVSVLVLLEGMGFGPVLGLG